MESSTSLPSATATMKSLASLSSATARGISGGTGGVCPYVEFRVLEPLEEEEDRLISFAKKASSKHGAKDDARRKALDDAEIAKGMAADHAFEIKCRAWQADLDVAPLLRFPGEDE